MASSPGCPRAASSRRAERSAKRRATAAPTPALAPVITIRCDIGCASLTFSGSWPSGRTELGAMSTRRGAFTILGTWDGTSCGARWRSLSWAAGLVKTANSPTLATRARALGVGRAAARAEAAPQLERRAALAREPAAQRAAQAVPQAAQAVQRVERLERRAAQRAARVAQQAARAAPRPAIPQRRNAHRMFPRGGRAPSRFTTERRRRRHVRARTPRLAPRRTAVSSPVARVAAAAATPRRASRATVARRWRVSGRSPSPVP